MPKFIDRTASGRFFHTHLAYLAGLKQPGGGRRLPPKTPSRRRYSMKTEFLQNLKVGEQPLPKEVIDAILAENGRDIEDTRQSSGVRLRSDAGSADGSTIAHELFHKPDKGHKAA